MSCSNHLACHRTIIYTWQADATAPREGGISGGPFLGCLSSPVDPCDFKQDLFVGELLPKRLHLLADGRRNLRDHRLVVAKHNRPVDPIGWVCGKRSGGLFGPLGHEGLV